jgi:hypothetical protein
MIQSGEKLRKTPYMISRFRQMAYRLLFSQVSTGILLLTLTVCTQLYNLFSFVKSSDNSVLYTLYSLVVEAFVSVQSGVGTFILSDDYQLGGGGTIYISCICYVVAFIFVPPRAADLDLLISDGTGHEYAIMERDLVEFASVDNALTKKEISPFQKSSARSIFCLETVPQFHIIVRNTYILN